MTFTVEQIEQARRHVEIVIRSSHLPGWKENREAWSVLNATFLDYAAMKRREASEVVGVLCVVTDEDSQYGISAHFSYSDNIAGLAPGDYECYTSPPSQPSTGVPEGYVMAPIEPTDAMVEAVINCIYSHAYSSEDAYARAVYGSAIAAAPRSP